MERNRRRSSILKKHPTEDTSPTQTFTRVNKRISFSGKNNVKEFVPADHGATIWCSSYELSAEGQQIAKNLENINSAATLTLPNRKLVIKNMVKHNKIVQNQEQQQRQCTNNIDSKATALLSQNNYNNEKAIYSESLEISMFANETELLHGTKLFQQESNTNTTQKNQIIPPNSSSSPPSSLPSTPQSIYCSFSLSETEMEKIQARKLLHLPLLESINETVATLQDDCTENKENKLTEIKKKMYDENKENYDINETIMNINNVIDISSQTHRQFEEIISQKRYKLNTNLQLNDKFNSIEENTIKNLENIPIITEDTLNKTKTKYESKLPVLIKRTTTILTSDLQEKSLVAVKRLTTHAVQDIDLTLCGCSTTVQQTTSLDCTEIIQQNNAIIQPCYNQLQTRFDTNAEIELSQDKSNLIYYGESNPLQTCDIDLTLKKEFDNNLKITKKDINKHETIHGFECMNLTLENQVVEEKNNSSPFKIAIPNRSLSDESRCNQIRLQDLQNLKLIDDMDMSLCGNNENKLIHPSQEVNCYNLYANDLTLNVNKNDECNENSIEQKEKSHVYDFSTNEQNNFDLTLQNDKESKSSKINVTNKSEQMINEENNYELNEIGRTLNYKQNSQIINKQKTTYHLDNLDLKLQNNKENIDLSSARVINNTVTQQQQQPKITTNNKDEISVEEKNNTKKSELPSHKNSKITSNRMSEYMDVSVSNDSRKTNLNSKNLSISPHNYFDFEIDDNKIFPTTKTPVEYSFSSSVKNCEKRSTTYVLKDFSLTLDADKSPPSVVTNKNNNKMPINLLNQDRNNIEDCYEENENTRDKINKFIARRKSDYMDLENFSSANECNTGPLESNCTSKQSNIELSINDNSNDESIKQMNKNNISELFNKGITAYNTNDLELILRNNSNDDLSDFTIPEQLKPNEEISLLPANKSINQNKFSKSVKVSSKRKTNHDSCDLDISYDSRAKREYRNNEVEIDYSADFNRSKHQKSDVNQQKQVEYTFLNKNNDIPKNEIEKLNRARKTLYTLNNMDITLKNIEENDKICESNKNPQKELQMQNEPNNPFQKSTFDDSKRNVLNNKEFPTISLQHSSRRNSNYNKDLTESSLINVISTNESILTKRCDAVYNQDDLDLTILNDEELNNEKNDFISKNYKSCSDVDTDELKCNGNDDDKVEEVVNNSKKNTTYPTKRKTIYPLDDLDCSDFESTNPVIKNVQQIYTAKIAQQEEPTPFIHFQSKQTDNVELSISGTSAEISFKSNGKNHVIMKSPNIKSTSEQKFIFKDHDELDISVYECKDIITVDVGSGGAAATTSSDHKETIRDTSKENSPDGHNFSISYSKESPRKQMFSSSVMANSEKRARKTLLFDNDDINICTSPPPLQSCHSQNSTKQIAIDREITNLHDDNDQSIILKNANNSVDLSMPKFNRASQSHSIFDSGSATFSPDTTEALCNDVNKMTASSSKHFHTCADDFVQGTIFNKILSKSSKNITTLPEVEEDDIEKTQLSLFNTLESTMEDVSSDQQHYNLSDVELNKAQTLCLTSGDSIIEDLGIICKNCKNCQSMLVRRKNAAIAEESADLTTFNITLPKFDSKEDLDLSKYKQVENIPSVRDVLDAFKKRRSLINSVVETDISTTEKSLIGPSVPSVKFLWDNYMEQYELKLEVELLIGATQPLAVSFETLFLNKIGSEENLNWDFIGLYMRHGFMEFRHKEIRNISLQFKFSAQAFYSNQDEIKFDEVLLKKSVANEHLSSLDAIIQKDLSTKIQSKLYCSSFNDLFNFLQNINVCCVKAIKLGENLFKTVIGLNSSILKDGNDWVIKKSIKKKEKTGAIKVQEFLIQIKSIEKLSYEDIILPPISDFKKTIITLPTGFDFLFQFLNNPIEFLKH